MNPAIWILLVGIGALGAGIYYMQRTKNGCVPAGNRVVIALGDSITARGNGAWGAELQRHLPPGSIVKVFGYPSQGTAYILGKAREVLPTIPGATDLVVLAGVNDLPTTAPVPNPAQITAIENNLRAIYDLGKSRGMRVVGVGVLPWSGSKYGGYNPLTQRLNAWIMATVPYVNTASLGTNGHGTSLDPRFSDVDGLHPNARGLAELGRLIYSQAFQLCR